MIEQERLTNRPVYIIVVYNVIMSRKTLTQSPLNLTTLYTPTAAEVIATDGRPQPVAAAAIVKPVIPMVVSITSPVIMASRTNGAGFILKNRRYNIILIIYDYCVSNRHAMHSNTATHQRNIYCVAITIFTLTIARRTTDNSELLFTDSITLCNNVTTKQLLKLGKDNYLKLKLAKLVCENLRAACIDCIICVLLNHLLPLCSKLFGHILNPKPFVYSMVKSSVYTFNSSEHRVSNIMSFWYHIVDIELKQIEIFVLYTC
ncbi:hypothetical protein AGLY_014922 [Aphis glycines]|uniref:Uncharacterized protein n=1 Tax=Aphis glycines TaxID=307491 RepID=A0A6G0T2Y9_APHGL|nr:hypothetical protein AGLY_014922 [Aphis glycines]